MEEEAGIRPGFLLFAGRNSGESTSAEAGVCGKVEGMMRHSSCGSRRAMVGLALMVLATASGWAVAPTNAAVSGFEGYTDLLEARLAKQHGSANGFIVLPPESDARLKAGEVVIERMTPDVLPVMPGAMLHDWRGTAFVPGATAADFERLMRDFAAYPQIYAPEVVQAKVLSQKDDDMQTLMRVRQKHAITVVMDTTYDVRFGKLDPQHRFSLSRSTQIDEIGSPGTPKEHALTPAEEHGFLWGLNSYWSCAEQDGGLYIQIESVSLTRDIPPALAWLIRPFVEGVPRESIEFTLRATADALKKKP